MSAWSSTWKMRSQEMRPVATAIAAQSNACKRQVGLPSRAATHRVAIVFTDGEPDDVEQAVKGVIRLRRAGIVLLAGTIDLVIANCAELFPGAGLFEVDPETAASSMATAIRTVGQVLHA